MAHLEVDYPPFVIWLLGVVILLVYQTQAATIQYNVIHDV